MEIILIIFIPIILWISSIYMLSDWDKFRSFFIANGILVIAYVVFLFYVKSLWKQDAYGLGMLYRLSICLMSHVLIVFVYAIFKRRYLKKTIANKTYK